ncbi:hypothetical protein [Acidipila sp. EB88]|uniref:hypothetical protein n=1 Tax=Acidipila sp. EB88 TaxID=2305226 RepID=UPI000F5FE500|nr:hypothetical protein [Acidipila sp. EB88]RRA49086.1 hypothetical protein D1Y84_13160 [Acidipila sp. EB88]
MAFGILNTPQPMHVLILLLVVSLLVLLGAGWAMVRAVRRHEQHGRSVAGSSLNLNARRETGDDAQRDTHEM